MEYALPDASHFAETGRVLDRARARMAAAEYDRAEELFEAALRQVEVLRDETLVASIQLEIGELRLLKGNYDAARASAVAAVEIFNRLGNTLPRALGIHLLGRVLAETGATELAERRLEEAAAIAERTGATLIQADALCELARLLRADGRPADALRALGGAYPLLHALRPTLHPEAIESRLRRLEELYLAVARDRATSAELAGAVGAGRGERVARIARALVDALDVGSMDRLPILFAASLEGVPAPAADASRRPGAARPSEGAGALPTGAASLRDLDLPWDLEPLLSVDGHDDDGAAPLGARVIALAVAIDALASAEAAHAAPIADRIRVAAASGAGGYGADLVDAVGRVDWAALLVPVAGGRDEADGRPVAREVPAAGGAAGKGRILVVDADPGSRRRLTELLGREGFQVQAVPSGDALFTLLGRFRPDLALLDMTAPARDGRRILERLRASPRWSGLPVVVVAAVRDPAEAARVLRDGADDCVERPIERPTLLARIERLLSLRRALAQAEQDNARRTLLLEIIGELTGSLDTQAMLDRLVRRIAEATGVAKCSLILAEPGGGNAHVVTAYDHPAVHGVPLELARYPEIRSALASGEVVVIEDVHAAPLLDRVRHEWATAVNVRSSAVVPLLVQGVPAGAILLRTTRDEPPLERSAVEFAAEVADAAGRALESARLFERVSADLAAAKEEVDAYRTLSMTDPLTGLANRAALESIGARLFLSAKALDQPLSVIVLDIDDLKALNDAFGHAAGDDALRHVAEALKAAASERDLVVRCGGEEFCLVMPERNLDDASRLGRTVCERVRRIRIPGRRRATLSASAGVATYPILNVPNLKELVAHADRALTRAKGAGGGHVEIAFIA